MFVCSLCNLDKESIYPAKEYQVCKHCDVWISSKTMCYECIVDHRIKHENEEHGSVELV